MSKTTKPGNGPMRKRAAKKKLGALQKQKEAGNYEDLPLPDILGRLALAIGADNVDILLRAISPSSPTYGNFRGSARAALPHLRPAGHNMRAHRLKQNESVREAIGPLLLRMGAGRDVRARMTADVLTGGYVSSTRMTYTDHEGRESQTVVERQPSASDVLKAVDISNKMDGTYSENKAKAQVVSDTFRGLMKRILAGDGVSDKSEQLDSKTMPVGGGVIVDDSNASAQPDEGERETESTRTAGSEEADAGQSENSTKGGDSGSDML